MKSNDIVFILVLVALCLLAGWLVSLIFHLILYIPLLVGGAIGYFVGYCRGSKR